MKATEILIAEHRIVESVLTALEAATDRLEQKQSVRPGFFVEAAGFSKGFTDGCHHRKEEGVLFKALVSHGLSDTSGPVAMMLAEHDQGRKFTKAMRNAACELENGDVTAAQRVIENARGYIALLRQHIQKEDRILFPLSDQVIPAAEQDKVFEDFKDIESSVECEGLQEKYLGVANVLQGEMA